MQLTLNISDEISLMEKYELTADELLFIRCILILQDDNNEELFKSLFKVLKTNGIGLRDLIVSLQNKRAILRSFQIPKAGEILDPFTIQINKNFIKNIYKSSFELGKELFENYPQFGQINNNTVPLRSVARHFDSLEDAYFRYGKNIGWNLERHNEIIELVKWAKENNIICQSLSSFIINNAWLDLEAMKNGDNGFNVNYDSIKLI